MRRAALLLVASFAACSSRPPESPFVRVTADDGRVYYADSERALHSPSGGFLTFRDLVTGETVRLKNGTYQAGICTREEVRERQVEYLQDPRRKPMAE